jgi:geranylgeranyl pyrophosphate synthase
MSRISRYQESMVKFIKNKSCINDLQDHHIKSCILEIISEFDHVASILLLTVLNNHGKRNGMTLHGYYISSSIEMMAVIANLLDNDKKYSKKYGTRTVQKIIAELTGLLNVCLSQNVESIQPHFSKERLLKIFHTCIRLINKRIPKLVSNESLEIDKKIRATDIIKYHFSDIQKIKHKLVKLKHVKELSLNNFISDKYGSICQLSLELGWLLSGGDEKSIPNLDKVGTYFSIVIKIAADLINLEQDIEDSESYSKNYAVNFGFQNAFEQFIDNKQKFIEGCILLDIYTNTVKEIIDLIENKIDAVIDKSSPDMKSHYTLES